MIVVVMGMAGLFPPDAVDDVGAVVGLGVGFGSISTTVGRLAPLDTKV